MSGIRILCYFSFLFLSISCASAQPTESIPLSKKEQKLFTVARAAYDEGDLQTSAVKLDELLDNKPAVAKAHYLRALIHRRLGEYARALTALEQGEQYDAKPSSTLFVEKGQLYAKTGDFKKSLIAFRQYLALVSTSSPNNRQRAEALVKQAEMAAQLASSPVPYDASPLTGGVNTADNLEYFPSLSTDGTVMVFTRRIAGGTEDFYRSEKQADGSWSGAVPLAGINTAEYNEGAQSISADGNLIVFTICRRPENRGSCDLYYSQRVDATTWTPARNMGRQINTDFHERQPSISADGRLLFFSSDRPNGIGGEDLYVSGRLPDGKWSAPSNLGKTINTSGNEQYPFWAADGKTLFFTSNKHPGLGGNDLFRTELTADNTWGTPVNLGYPINTADEETNIFIELNGTTAYFSKQYIRPGVSRPDVDIYTFELPPALRPSPATYLAATVIDAQSRQPLTATVRLTPLAQTAPPQTFSTDDKGTFLTVLPSGKDYALTVDLPGYLFYSDRFVLTGDLVPSEPYELTIELQPVTETITTGGTEEDGSTLFRNVLFETGSAVLLPVSGQELDRLVDLLKANPTLSVTIIGHTDDVGDTAANQQLSEDRAASVSEYIVNQGIDRARVTTTGYGESRPVADNESPEGRAQNRRTTFKLREQ